MRGPGGEELRFDQNLVKIFPSESNGQNTYHKVMTATLLLVYFYLWGHPLTIC